MFDYKEEEDWNLACCHHNAEIWYISWGVPRLPGFILGNIEPYWIKHFYSTFGCGRPRNEQLNCFACYCRISWSRNARTRRLSKCYKTKLIARLVLPRRAKVIGKYLSKQSLFSSGPVLALKKLALLVEILANKFCPSAVVPALQSIWVFFFIYSRIIL